MAPKRSRSNGESKPTTVEISAPPSRVTRSSTRRLNGNSVAESPAAKPEAELTKSKKKAKPTPKKEVAEEKEAPPAVKVAGSEAKTIVIEHCKQCNRFKTRAAKVKEALEKEFPGFSILVNPEKPRRGCFEVREEGGEKFITLLDLKRPFVPLTDLDMDKVVADIIDKIK